MHEITTAMRDEPRITLEEIDGEEVVVNIAATPMVASEGPQLASELLAVVAQQTRQAEDDEDSQSPSGATR